MRRPRIQSQADLLVPGRKPQRWDGYLDRSDPMFREMGWLFTAWSPEWMRDDFLRREFSHFSGTFQHGSAEFDGASSYGRFFAPEVGARATVFAVARLRSAGQISSIIGRDESGGLKERTGKRAYQFRFDTDGSAEFIPFSSNSPVTVTGGGSLTGRTVTLVGIVDGSTARLYVDGALVSSLACGLLDRDGTEAAVGARINNASGEIENYAPIDMYLAGEAQRAWTDREARDWSSDPFRFLRRPLPVWLYSSPAGGGGVTLSPGGVASAEAHGTAAVVPGAVTLSPAAIASAEAHGTPTVQAGALTLSLAGIASAEAVSVPAMAAGAVVVAPEGIVSLQAVGTPAAVPGAVSVAPDAIASAEAHGTPGVAASGTLQPSAVPSAEAVGVLTLAPGQVVLAPAGIASLAALGTPSLSGVLTLSPTGIASLESHGVAGITAGALIVPDGVASAEAIGVLQVAPGAVTLAPGGIGTGESHGATVVQPGAQVLLPAGVDSGEVVGDSIVIPGAVVVQPSGVASAEAHGTVAVVGGAQLLGWLVAQVRARPALAARLRVEPALPGTARVRPWRH